MSWWDGGKRAHSRKCLPCTYTHAGQSSETKEIIFKNSTFSGSVDNVMSLGHLRCVGSKERIWYLVIPTISLDVEFCPHNSQNATRQGNDRREHGNVVDPGMRR